MEDPDDNVWLVTLDMAKLTPSADLPPDLRWKAELGRDNVRSIMSAGANGVLQSRRRDRHNLMEDGSVSDDKTMQALRAQKVLCRFGFGLGALGAILGAFGVYFLLIGNETLSWPSVQGSVVRAEVSTDVTIRPGATSAARKAYTQYYVTVHYTYDVEGEPYFSSRYSLGEADRASRLYSERADARAEGASRFPAGTAVSVHYDPNDPTEAVLKAGWNWGTFVPLLMGLCFGGVGWLFYSVGKSTKVTPD